MLDHVSITVTNIGAAEKFYDAVMNALECQRTEKSDLRLGYGERCNGDHPDRTLRVDQSRWPARRRSGAALVFQSAPNRAIGDAFWKAGMANGGNDSGPPGIRDSIRVTTLPS